MKNYYLFIDTETDGLPQNWTKSYTETDNWPHIIQISWVIYTKDGKHISESDHYIQNDAIKISEISFGIHHISEAYLKENGKPLEPILKKLEEDIIQYDPIVVGHFIEFDVNMISCEYTRLNQPSIIVHQPAYCTMIGSKELITIPTSRKWKLGELYFYLFKKEQLHPHNAIFDAKATAECFFELKSQFGLLEDSILQQNPTAFVGKIEKPKKKLGWIFFVTILILALVIYTAGRIFAS